MEQFEYYNPDRIIFGPGERKRIGGECAKRGCKRVLLTVSKGPFRENGLYDEIKGSLESAGVRVFGIGDIDSNPRISSVREGAALCKGENIDGVVALGGGSTMDCSKVIAAAATVGDDPWEYLWGHKKTFPASLPTFMIPTMAATGTEVNPWAVIMDEDAAWKSACTSEVMYPTVTIQDPEITLTVPINLTVWGAMDILSHTFEFYFNGNRDSIFQNRFSEATIHSVIECVNILVDNPKDLRARGELMYSSIMAWGGLNFLGRGGPDMACHTIAEGFVPCYDIHHGASLGVITPRWMRFAAPKAPAYFARFAREIFGLNDVSVGGVIDLADRGVEAYIAWLKKIKAPDTLQDLTGEKIEKEKLKEIVDRTYEDAGGKVGVLVEMSREEAVDLLMACQKPL